MLAYEIHVYNTASKNIELKSSALKLALLERNWNLESSGLRIITVKSCENSKRALSNKASIKNQFKIP